MNKMEQKINKLMQYENVNLVSQNIGDDELKYLCKRNTVKVKILYLNFNKISEIGALHLSQVKWSRLTQLVMIQNKIGNRGCQYLSRTSFIKLQHLNLSINLLESAGVSHLGKGQWKKLNKLSQLYHIKYNFKNKLETPLNYFMGYNFTNLYGNKLPFAESLRIILSQTALLQMFLNKSHIEKFEERGIWKAIQSKYGDITTNI